jgi:DNA-binding transcriptional LysR family regulator
MLPTVAVAREVRLGQLRALRCPELKLSVFTCLVWHRDKWLPAAARAFIEVCREVLSGASPGRRRAG